MTTKLMARMLGLMAFAIAQTVCAQTYPAKPITLIVPFAPGASADGIARLLSKELSTTLGQPVIVENKPGAGGTVGLLSVAHAKPDGYTLGMGATGAIAVNPHLPDPSTLKPQTDLAAVAKLANIPLVLIAGKAAGYSTLKDMLEKARAHPKDTVIYGTPGQYTSQHLSVELMARMAGIKMSAVPYRGSGPAVTDVLGGQIGVAMVDLTSAYPHIKSGALIALGVTSAKRSKVAPDLPTIAEAGVPGYDAPAWMGLFAPAGVQPEIINKISNAVKIALAKPEVQQKMIFLAADPSYENAEDFSKFTQAESKKWGHLLQSISGSM